MAVTAKPAGVRLRRRDRLHAARLDWVLVAAALALSLLGCVLIASAGAETVGSAPAKRQLLSVIVAVVLAFAVTRVEPRSLRADGGAD